MYILSRIKNQVGNDKRAHGLHDCFAFRILNIGSNIYHLFSRKDYPKKGPYGSLVSFKSYLKSAPPLSALIMKKGADVTFIVTTIIGSYLQQEPVKPFLGCDNLLLVFQVMFPDGKLL